MRIEKYIHTDIPDNKEEAEVEILGGISLSQSDGGCDAKGCNCSPGHWMAIRLPRTDDGTVEGISVYFDSKEEMMKLFDDRELKLKEQG